MFCNDISTEIVRSVIPKRNIWILTPINHPWFLWVGKLLLVLFISKFWVRQCLARLQVQGTNNLNDDSGCITLPTSSENDKYSLHFCYSRITFQNIFLFILRIFAKYFPLPFLGTCCSVVTVPLAHVEFMFINGHMNIGVVPIKGQQFWK